MRKEAKQTVLSGKPLIERRMDSLLGGGFSLLIAVAVIIYGSISVSSMDTALKFFNDPFLGFVSLYLGTELLINSPHFMASYRILYSKRKNFRKYPFVTIILPALAVLLLGYLCYWGPAHTNPETTSGATLEISQATIRVRGNVVSRWQIGEAKASLLEGDCELQYDNRTVRADAILLAVDGPTGHVRTRIVIQRDTDEKKDVPQSLTLLTMQDPQIIAPRMRKKPADPPDLQQYLPSIPRPRVMIVLSILAPIFLGWHYMGQSWGTTACFAYLSGFRMAPIQRKLIRFGFLSLFAYHLTWACATMELLEMWLPQQDAGAYLIKALMSFCRVLVLFSFFAGLWGLWLLSQEQKRSIPAVVWLPWVATYSWYVMVDIYPQSFFLLQIFHALQYLMFPARVEINEHRSSRLRVHMLVYYVALVILGYVAFEWTQVLEWTHLVTPSSTLLLLGTATMMIINIHHYFIDAVIWKIRDPEVRESLFGHMETD